MYAHAGNMPTTCTAILYWACLKSRRPLWSLLIRREFQWWSTQGLLIERSRHGLEVYLHSFAIRESHTDLLEYLVIRATPWHLPIKSSSWDQATLKNGHSSKYEITTTNFRLVKKKLILMFRHWRSLSNEQLFTKSLSHLNHLKTT